MLKNSKKGFTLIELLVVIAIIGILSSVVLASLNSGRGKTKDAAIKSTLANLRGQAEIFYDQSGYYGSVTFGPLPCSSDVTNTIFSDPKVQSFILSVGDLSVAGGGLAQVGCVSTSNAWAVSVPLFTDSSKSWCVDSQGASREVDPSAFPPYGFNVTDCS